MSGLESRILKEEFAPAVATMQGLGLGRLRFSTPMAVWELPSVAADSKYLVFLTSGTGPTTNYAGFMLFSHQGRLLGQWEITLGTGGRIRSAALRLDSQLGASVANLSLIGNSTETGAIEQTLLYAVVGDSLYLIRLESATGGILLNDYKRPDRNRVPRILGRPLIHDWPRLLASPVIAERLAALLYLGGQHPQNPPSAVAGTPGSATGIEDLRADPEVRRMVFEYHLELNPWLREAAEMALLTLP